MPSKAIAALAMSETKPSGRMMQMTARVERKVMAQISVTPT